MRVRNRNRRRWKGVRRHRKMEMISTPPSSVHTTNHFCPSHHTLEQDGTALQCPAPAGHGSCLPKQIGCPPCRWPVSEMLRTPQRLQVSSPESLLLLRCVRVYMWYVWCVCGVHTCVVCVCVVWYVWCVYV